MPFDYVYAAVLGNRPFFSSAFGIDAKKEAQNSEKWFVFYFLCHWGLESRVCPFSLNTLGPKTNLYGIN